MSPKWGLGAPTIPESRFFFCNLVSFNFELDHVRFDDEHLNHVAGVVDQVKSNPKVLLVKGRALTWPSLYFTAVSEISA